MKHIAAIDTAHLHYEDASETLTERNLMIYRHLNSAGANQGTTAQTVAANEAMDDLITIRLDRTHFVHIGGQLRKRITVV